VLGFAGGKLLLANWIKIPPLVSVGVIAACITISVIASIRANRRDARDTVVRILREDLQKPQVPET
jgi:hypothetical protein